MENIWDSQGSRQESSVTYHVQERITQETDVLVTKNIQYKDNVYVFVILQ